MTVSPLFHHNSRLRKPNRSESPLISPRTATTRRRWRDDCICPLSSHCFGPEQAIRYACILLDLADDTQRDFDEFFIERNQRGNYWIHFAVRPTNNRRKLRLMNG